MCVHVHDYPFDCAHLFPHQFFKIYIGFDWISRERAELKQQSLVYVTNGFT